MPIYKRCDCEPWSECPHPYHYRFGWRGTTYRGSTKVPTKQLAERFEQSKLKAVKRGEVPLHKCPKLEDYLPEFGAWIQAHQTLRTQSKLFYGRGVKLLMESPLAKLPMDRINDSLCATIKFTRGGNYYENMALKTLRRALSEAEKAGFLGRTPRIGLRPVEGRKLLLDASYEEALAPHMSQDGRDAICIMRQSGMRISEVLAMDWVFLDWERSVYRNPRGKTRKSERTVLLARAAMEALHNRHVRQGLPKAGWAFPWPTSKTGHRNSIGPEFRRARKAAGLPPELVPHCARHDAGTNYMRISGNPKLVMDLLGHGDIATTARYTHPSEIEVQRIRDAFDATTPQKTAQNSTPPQNTPRNLQNLKVVSPLPQ